MQMVTSLKASFRRIWHPASALFFFGTLSLILGALLAARAETSAFSLMRLAVPSLVSIVPLLALQLLPFLIAAYAVSISGPWLLTVVCSFKLFFFSYFGTLIWIAFGAAGWLVRFLLLFSDIILIPVLCWYCFRRMAGEYPEKNDLGFCLGAVLLTALINCYFISPFLAKIL